MEKEIKVESLKISIGKKEIELNIDDAKKLKKALEDIFGKEVVHEYHYDWWYRPYQPYTPYWGTITCGNLVDITGGNSTATVANAMNLTPTQLCMNIS
jgi:hypothetical protein